MSTDGNLAGRTGSISRSTRALLGLAILAAGLALAPVGVAFAQTPLVTYDTNPENNPCERDRPGPDPTPPDERPVITSFSALSSKSDPITVGVAARLETRVSFSPGRSIRPTEGFCGWHGDFPGLSNYRYHNSTLDPHHNEYHTYARAGYYEPRIYVIDDRGVFSAQARKLFYVNALPAASFRYSPTAPRSGETVTFTSTSTDEETGGITQQQWDLDGNGSYEASGASARRAYSTATTVRLRVTDKRGATAVSEQRVVPGTQPPAASFSYSPQPAAAGEAVQFRSTSSDPDGSVTGWQWDLDGDGVYSDATGPTVSQAFPAEGDYRIGLEVTDNAGATATSTQLVRVTPPRPLVSGPVAAGAFGAPTAGAAQPVRLRRVSARIRLRAARTRTGARVSMLAVSAARGATVRVRCAGRGCPRGIQSRRAAGRSLRFTRFQRTLRAGNVLQVRVTKPGSVGRYTSIRIRKGARPLRKDLCLAPGSRRPSRC